MSGAPLVPLAAYFAALAAERTFELRLSAAHARTQRARGAVEHGRSHYGAIVALHVAWPLALAFEVLILGARPAPAWPLWLALLLLANALRAWCMVTLGKRWTTRILVAPGVPPVAHGPYRWLAHPNYLAVGVELLAAPLMFGAWRTALAASLVNLALMVVRIRTEHRALYG